jgi:acyl carrier protein
MTRENRFFSFFSFVSALPGFSRGSGTKKPPNVLRQYLTRRGTWDIKRIEGVSARYVLPTRQRAPCDLLSRALVLCVRKQTGWVMQDQSSISIKGDLDMDTFEKIRTLLAEQLDIDPETIEPDSDIMNDFEADSLDIVDMIMTLEDEFGIEVPDEAIENLHTVGDVVQFVDAHKV